jgi:hypothetical protein
VRKSSAEILEFCLASFSTAVANASLADPAFVGSTVLGAKVASGRRHHNDFPTPLLG